MPGPRVDQVLVLLGVRWTRRGYEVTELLRRPEALWSGPYDPTAAPVTGTVLSLAAVDAASSG